MKHWILALAALCVGATAQAQNTGRVTGKVTAEGGLPVAQAQVTALGINRTAVTDSSGVYEIAGLPTGLQSVQARRIGYTPVTLQVTVRTGESSTLNFQLSSAAVQLEGLTVVAYGQQERRDVTGAITSVNMEQLRDVPVPNAAQLLQARVPGVDVVATSNRPGAAIQVRVRGIRSMAASNDPLYVVDGVPIQGGIQDFDPSMIQSIEVLKDASATAPYGSAGANGVILVTTARGGAQGSRFSYDVQYGSQSALRHVQMMNGAQLAQERIDANLNAGRPTALTSVFNPLQLPTAYCALNVPTTAAGVYDTLGTSTYRATHPGCATGTNWQDLISRTGNQQRHQISYSSVTGTARLSLTGTYFDQNGITVGQGYNQYAGTVSFENTFGILRVGVTASGSRSIADIGGDAQLWGEALGNDPLGLPYIDSAGNPSAVKCASCTVLIKPTNDPLRVNPLIELNGYVHQQTRDRLFGSLYAELTLPYGFSYRVDFGPDVSNVQDGQFQAAQVNVGSTPLGNAQAGYGRSNDFRYTLDNLINYNYEHGNHKVQGTFLYGIAQDRFNWDSAAARNIPYDYQLWYNLGTGDDPQPPRSSFSQFTTESYMGRLNYTFMRRYSVTVTGRRDGSSVLAPGHKWAFFPSAGLAWQAGDESFMRRFGFVSSLKFRGSWGVTGNSAVQPYQTEGSLNRTTYNFGAGSAAGYVPGQIPNPDLVWEKTTQLDFGVDFGFFANRITGTFDVYREKTKDLLLQRQLPASTGFTSTLQNVGQTGNAGWELAVSTVNLPGTSGGPRWTTDFDFSHVQNYIISLSTGAQDDPGNRWFIGQPINIGGATNLDALHNVFYDLKFVGIWQLADSALARQYGQKPGDIRVADINGDGKIDGFDRVITGNTYPKLIADMTNRLSWGPFDLSFLIEGRIGYTMLDGFASNTKLFERYNQLNVQYWSAAKCGGAPGSTATTAAQQAAIPGCNSWPAPSAGRENPLYNDLNYAVLSYRSGTNWRVRNITVGYTLPESVARRFRFRSVRIYAVAQDPFVITPYYGFDPENGSASGPPSYRTLLVGATFGF
jgi:TonB-linked SusC/RagA family outer membrane protein